MKNSRQNRKIARRLHQLCLVDGRPDAERVRQITRSLLAKQPRGVAAILAEFLNRLKIDAASHRLLIESAVDLDDTVRQTLTQRLAARFGAGFEPEFKTNPALLGGLRIQAGWDRFDTSISGRLRQVLTRLNATQRSS